VIRCSSCSTGSCWDHQPDQDCACYCTRKCPKCKHIELRPEKGPCSRIRVGKALCDCVHPIHTGEIPVRRSLVDDSLAEASRMLSLRAQETETLELAIANELHNRLDEGGLLPHGGMRALASDAGVSRAYVQEIAAREGVHGRFAPPASPRRARQSVRMPTPTGINATRSEQRTTAKNSKWKAVVGGCWCGDCDGTSYRLGSNRFKCDHCRMTCRGGVHVPRR
jgi:hypothetical protein